MINNLLKLMIVVLCIVWLYNNLSSYIENFSNLPKSQNNKSSLFEVISGDCKPEYCNVNNWPALGVQNTKIPDGYVLTQFSTAKGCCIIPSNLNEYIYDSNGDNKYRMTNVGNDIIKN